jgi:photosystem II stability/assembly factor-like uncharacterized protein
MRQDPDEPRQGRGKRLRQLAFALIALTTLLPSLSFAQAPAPAAAAPKPKGIWEPVNFSEDISLTDVFFVTPEIGYVAGAAGTILKTSDAGENWTALLGGDPASEERAIRQLWFITPTTGWAAQTTSTETHLFGTTDGETWLRVGEIDEHYDDFAFGNESEGLFVNDEKIHRTTDGGKSWNLVHECAVKAEVEGLMRQVVCFLWKVRYVSPTRVFALGQAYPVQAAVLLKSEDSGASWEVVTVMDGESATEGGLFFLDENTGYLSTTYSKAAYRTNDGGRTWTGMPATTMGRRIIFADPEVGWALHYNKLTYTTDGGKRWFSRELKFPAMPEAFSLPRRDRGYVVGEHGMIYRYSVVEPTAPVSAKAIAAPAMPTLDNAVLNQLAQLETRIEKLDAVIGSAGATAPNGGDWSNATVDQNLAQLQATVDTVANGVPAMARKHRNLNLVMLGLDVLGDLTGQGSSLKAAFTTLKQSKDLGTASTALQDLHGQVEAMKANVELFKTARKSGK